MPREYGRNKRVADLVQRELAEIIPREETDTGVILVTISHVDVSPDLSFAKIYITCLDTAKSRTEVVDILNEFAGVFRRQLAKRLKLRIVPRIKFLYDESIERGARMEALIDSLHKGEK